MWPKAFAQLVELAPHISRLLPMADRFFQNKTVGDDASRKAIEKLAEGLRGDLVQVTAANAGFYDQITAFDGQIKGFDQRLESFDEKLNAVVVDAQAARAAAESVQGRLASIEARQGRMLTLFAVVLVLLAVVLVLLVLLYLRSR
ncbi:MAG: hypothetical protein ACRYFU_12645 [Janthinobacterium lividum]